MTAFWTTFSSIVMKSAAWENDLTTKAVNLLAETIGMVNLCVIVTRWSIMRFGEGVGSLPGCARLVTFTKGTVRAVVVGVSHLALIACRRICPMLLIDFFNIVLMLCTIFNLESYMYL